MKKSLALLFAFLMVCSVANAVPALSIPRTYTQSDGTVITVTLIGDEFSHTYITSDGMAVSRQENGDFYYRTVDGVAKTLAHNPSERTAQEQAFVQSQHENLKAEMVLSKNVSPRYMKAMKIAAKKNAQVPQTGSPKIPIILVQYSDVSFKDADPKATYEQEMNGEDASVLAYFKSQSFGKLTPTFDVLGPVTLSNPRSYYGANDSNGDDVRPGEMVQEACQMLDADVNFADYDNDKDGYVDAIYVIYAGVGEATSSLASSIWPHQWYLSSALGSAMVADGVKLDEYGCNNELVSGKIGGIGTFCHEFSHCLGLPDLYDTHYSGAYGMNSWSLMGTGSYNNNSHTPSGYTAYEREFMGWIDIETLTDKKISLSMDVLADGGKAYRIQSPYNKDEYYLLENRQQKGWDEYIASHGMMVTHVDYNEAAWSGNTVNDLASHQRLTIIPADNKLSASTNSGDLFPNGGSATELTDNSTPAAKLFTGEYMGQPITNITEVNSVITFDFNDKSEAPVLSDATEVSENSFTANWSSVDDAVSYTLSVKKIEYNDGELLLSEDFGKFIAGGSDISSQLDNYMNNAGWEGKTVYGEEKAVRLGTSSSTGYLRSPHIDLSGCDGTVTVAITAKSYNSDYGVKLDVGLASDESDELYDGATFDVTSTATQQYAVLSGVGSDTNYIQIANELKKKRAVVSGVAIYTGDVSEKLKAKGYQAIGKKSMKQANAAKKSSVSKTVNASDVTLFEGLTGTSYTVTGLEAGGKYRYCVKTVYAEGESAYSAANTVVLAGTSAVIDTEIANAVRIVGNRLTIASDEPSAVYTAAGVEVQETSLKSYELTSGVYIVKVGAKASKVMVK